MKEDYKKEILKCLEKAGSRELRLILHYLKAILRLG